MIAAKTFLGTVAATALTFALGFAPAQAVTFSSPDGPRSITFSTALAPQYFGAGEYDGVLHLTFGSDGTVNGWYRPTDSFAIRTVTGGLDGNKLWLSFSGSTGPGFLSEINATIDGSKIEGGTYYDDQLYTFTATPQK